MATEHFCLRWNNHQSTLVSVFDNLLESGTLVDCTLAADGRYLKAHKVVLSACSPYLGMLLSQHYDKHPIIILKDVKFDELKAMLDYMYRGEVNISQEQLSTFLKAAETLQIKGLTDAGSDEGNGLQPNRPPSSNSTTSANEDPQSPGPPGDGGSSPGPRKRKRNKHGDEEGDSVSKISLSEGSDRLSGASVGSPSAKSASVKREPGDGEGDGQMSVDDSGEVVMMSRPGPSNGGTNSKAPWILSADSSGEEMQLTPGQDGQERRPKGQVNEIKEEAESSEKGLQLEEIKKEIKQEVDPFEEEINPWEKENELNTTGQNSQLLYTVARSEDELIIPDQLGEPSLVNEESQNFQPLESVFSTTLRDSSEGMDSNGSMNCDYKFVQGNLSPFQQSMAERARKEESMRIQEYLKNKDVRLVQNTSSSSVSKSHTSPVTVKDSQNDRQTHVPLSSQLPPKSSFQSSSTVKCPKIVVKIADAFDKSKVQVKEAKLDFVCKYRKILPAPKSKKALSQLTKPSSSEKQSTNPRSTPPLKVEIFKAAEAENTSKNVHVEQNNSLPPLNQEAQGGLVNNFTLSPSMLSVPQQIQVSQIANPNPSVLSYPQPVQGSKLISDTSNVLSVPQNIQLSQMNSQSTALISIPPQFSVSPVQAGNIQVQFSNNTQLQSGNLHNSQFFTNANTSQNQLVNNHNSVMTHQAQPLSHPILVSSNIIGSCQTSNQFLPSTAVQYNFSTAQRTLQPNFNTAQLSVQPNFSVSTVQTGNTTSQSNTIQSTVNCTTSTQTRGPGHSVFQKRPSGFVQARLNLDDIARGRGTFSPSLQVRGRPSQRGMFPPQGPKLLPKPIFPKK